LDNGDNGGDGGGRKERGSEEIEVGWEIWSDRLQKQKLQSKQTIIIIA
jgi:hypothetical protein